MKFSKWTLGLAAVGVVSLASAAKADDAAPSTVLTALSSTTLSGYVDTSMQWNFGTGNANNPPYAFGGASKADGFNLNVVQLSLDKPLDESQWAAGYHVDLWMGPDANTLGTQSTGTGLMGAGGDFAIRQAYVALRMPVGNGIDWKIGVFDTIIGYESLASVNNPNYTRSYGFTIEPTTHTGVLASYRITDAVALSGGVANTAGPVINNRAFQAGGAYNGAQAESYKTYMASINLTAPQDWGFLSGSTLTAGFVNGINEGVSTNNPTANYYVGTTIATPVTNLKLGGSFDYRNVNNAGGDAYALALYASYQATEKLSLNARQEYVNPIETSSDIWATTLTAQYDLWKNVLSRVEFRWDHGDSGKVFGADSLGAPNRRNAFMLAANIIYKF